MFESGVYKVAHKTVEEPRSATVCQVWLLVRPCVIVYSCLVVFFLVFFRLLARELVLRRHRSRISVSSRFQSFFKISNIVDIFWNSDRRYEYKASLKQWKVFSFCVYPFLPCEFGFSMLGCVASRKVTGGGLCERGAHNSAVFSLVGMIAIALNNRFWKRRTWSSSTTRCNLRTNGGKLLSLSLSISHFFYIYKKKKTKRINILQSLFIGSQHSELVLRLRDAQGCTLVLDADGRHRHPHRYRYHCHSFDGVNSVFVFDRAVLCLW